MTKYISPRCFSQGPKSRKIEFTSGGGDISSDGSLVFIREFNRKPGLPRHAGEILSPTVLYRGTFEQGTRLVPGDRSHCFISGTASIDSKGQVVHPFDVTKQTERLVDNVAALLESSAGTLSDLKWATVYLRDPADAALVRNVLAQRLPPELPFVIVRAPVCRPAWLVEMECVAVNHQGNPAFAPLS